MTLTETLPCSFTDKLKNFGISGIDKEAMEFFSAVDLKTN